MTERKYAEIADASHRAFHDFYLNDLPKEIAEKLHALFDTLVSYLQNAQKDIDSYEGKLKEAEKIIAMAITGAKKQEIDAVSPSVNRSGYGKITG